MGWCVLASAALLAVMVAGREYGIGGRREGLSRLELFLNVEDVFQRFGDRGHAAEEIYPA
jgi:hypothetical protein